MRCEVLALTGSGRCVVGCAQRPMPRMQSRIKDWSSCGGLWAKCSSSDRMTDLICVEQWGNMRVSNSIFARMVKGGSVERRRKCRTYRTKI